MKRTLAILLAAMLVMLGAVACAEDRVQLNENSDSLDFFLVLPDGTTLKQAANELGSVGLFETQEEGGLVIRTALVPDDSYVDTDIAALTDEERQQIIHHFEEDLSECTTEVYEMPCGLHALSIRTTDNTEYLALTLLDGYFFYMAGLNRDYSPLTDEEITTVKTAFDSLTYTKGE